MFVAGSLASLAVAPAALAAPAAPAAPALNASSPEDLCGMPVPPEALQHAAPELAAYRANPTAQTRQAALLKLFAPETGLAWQAVPFAARPPACP